MAFPPGPGAKTNFYVYYTRPSDGASVISRFRIGTDTNHVDPATEEVILTPPRLGTSITQVNQLLDPTDIFISARGDSDAPS